MSQLRDENGRFARATTPKGNRPAEPIVPSGEMMDSAFIASLMGMGIPAVYANDHSVGGLPAISRGVDLVANAVATMMSSADVVMSGGEVSPTPANIVTRPNVIYGSYEFWDQCVRSLMMRGNYIGILTDFDTFGYARQVVPVSVDVCSLDISSGIPIYHIFEDVYGPADVVHVRSHAPVGSLWGRGIIERHRSELTGMLYQSAYGSNSWQSGGVPSAIISLDTDKVKKEVADGIQTAWIERHGNGQRKPAVIPGKAMTITPLSWKPEDLEFVESKKMSIAESALICGLRPEDLGAAIGGSNLSYGNRTDDALQRILDSYNRWLQLIENAWSDLLPGSNYVRGNVEALLRTTTLGRYEVYAAGKALGIYTDAEIRALEHRPALPTTASVPAQPSPPLQLVQGGGQMPALTQGTA